MESNQYTPILKRAGTVLLAVGLIDIGIKIYSVVHHISHPTVTGVTAVVAGVLLLRGNLIAASTIRWGAIGAAAGSLVLPCMVFCFLQPFDLSMAEVRQYPTTYLFLLIRSVVATWVLLWVFMELKREPVEAAITDAGIRQYDFRLCAVGGIVLTVAIGVIFGGVLTHGESSKHAILLAEKRMGSGYQFHVDSIGFVRNSRGKFFTANVYAWNEKSLWNVPVRWRER